MQGHQKGEIALKVENKPIDSIKPYENNPRDNDDAINAVANSIHEFGWQQPIVVDKDNVIIAGHTRYKAAQSLGLKEVPVVVASNLSDQQVKAYRLADNKTAELADWDTKKLDEELQDILDIDMTDFGFDEDIEFDPADDVDTRIDEPTDIDEDDDLIEVKCPKCGEAFKVNDSGEVRN